ncbi:MAG TPA: hypothetical protein VG474_15660 [Solirubrobacteraceae bacterium]|nr:hypothetical protein [Solirubrobacteraceae bacterium]
MEQSARTQTGGPCRRELSARIEERLGHRTHCVLDAALAAPAALRPAPSEGHA